MEETKEYCEQCKDYSESTFSENLEKYLCEECWDMYGELCCYGLA